MDDLKVVLYIVIAIIWVVYNNYKKISQESKKRNLSKPPSEVIQENWPRTIEPPAKPVEKKQRQIIEKPSPRPARPILQRKPLAGREPIRKREVITKKETITIPSYSMEGGRTTPSKVVQFEEPVFSEQEQNPLLESIRNMDLKQGIIMAEILKRPYY